MQWQAHEEVCDTICAAVAKGGYDAILRDLHGAMVAEGFEDGGGELLRRIRAIDPMTPIGVAYDMHAKVYGPMLETPTIAAGYHTYPHIGQEGTAEYTARVLLRAMHGEVRPVSA